ncbi:MAG: phosphate/phosphite/phosphonate ABC transporter substrate-binding protein [Gammaproteobacteria bacterium]|nr:phosphate/phosphite/phosphonate ABC transporter substrate-binding protein [Gammaproteobacteria bacterium]
MKTQRQKEKSDIYYFGFDLRSSPQEDSRQYLPFLSYLEKSTGYQFELRFTPKKSSIIDELGQGNVHFAALGAVSYIKAHEKYGVSSIARGLNLHDKANYQSIIVVNKSSTIKTVGDLKNKRFAFGDINSTQGHLIPRIILQQHSINLTNLKSYEYTGSHQNCAEAVITLKADACGMQDTMARVMAKENKLKILYESTYYPSSGVAANQRLPPDVVERVRQALLNFDPQGKHKEGLYHWLKTEMPNGFAQVEEKDYLELRKWLINFDMMELGSLSDLVQ